MKPLELFELAVRILGLIFIYHGLSTVPVLFQGRFGSAGNVISFIFMVGWPLIVGFGLLKFAREITEFFSRSED
jgi:hypothetical protein